jgi:hypothetical protein
MSRRYFYTDPLAAAWMAKHHSVEFWHTMVEILVRAKRQHQEWADTVGNHYIHPNSLHLLEPQIGDVYYNSCNGSYHEVTEKGPPKYVAGSCEIHWRYSGCKPDDITLSTATGWWNAGDTHDRIIQRGGILFHWPESEAV